MLERTSINVHIPSIYGPGHYGLYIFTFRQITVRRFTGCHFPYLDGPQYNGPYIYFPLYYGPYIYGFEFSVIIRSVLLLFQSFKFCHLTVRKKTVRVIFFFRHMPVRTITDQFRNLTVRLIIFRAVTASLWQSVHLFSEDFHSHKHFPYIYGPGHYGLYIFTFRQITVRTFTVLFFVIIRSVLLSFQSFKFYHLIVHKKTVHVIFFFSVICRSVRFRNLTIRSIIFRAVTASPRQLCLQHAQ